MESVPVYSSESGTTTSLPNNKNLHKRNTKGETLLHLACRRQDVAQVRALINAGLDVNTTDFAGWTALHEAALSGDRAVVEELLRAGARVNARSVDGDTALHDAVSSENYQVVKLLLEHGSNPQDKNVGGLCALDMAESRDIKELLQAFDQSAPGSLCLEADSRTVPPSVSSENVGQSRTSAQIDSKGLALVLSEVEVKQAELRKCSVKGPEDAGRYFAALRDIHSTLSQVLAKQHMEKDNLTHKYWSVPDCLRKRILKSQLISLASVQKKLVDVLQKQMEVVDELSILKSEPSSQPRNNEQTQSSECPAMAPPRVHVTAAVQSPAVDTIGLSAPPAPILVNKTPISLHQGSAKESQKSAAKIISIIVSPRKLVPTPSITNGTTQVCPQQLVPTASITNGTLIVSPRQQVPTANRTNGPMIVSPRQLVPTPSITNGTTPVCPQQLVLTATKTNGTLIVSPQQQVPTANLSNGPMIGSPRQLVSDESITNSTTPECPKQRVPTASITNGTLIVSPRQPVPTANIAIGPMIVSPRQLGPDASITNGTMEVSPRQLVPTASVTNGTHPVCPRQQVHAASITNGTMKMSPLQLVPFGNVTNGTISVCRQQLVPTNSITTVSPRHTVSNASITNGTMIVSPRQPVTTIRVISNQTTVPSSSKSNQRSLLKLLHGRVMSPGHPLLFVFKGIAHSAVVESCGLMKDSKGRLHLTPEDWIKSIVGNNIPVGAAYAWDKVTYSDRPLSHHWLKMEQTQAGGVEEEPLCTSSAPDTPTAVLDGLSLLMKIKLVRVVGDDELVPNVLMDKVWEELVKEDNWIF